MTSRAWPAIVAGAVAVIVGCGSNVSDTSSVGAGGGGMSDGGAGGTGGSGGQGGAGGGEGGAGGGPINQGPDLFECALPIDCAIDYGHLGETVTEEDLRCAGELAVSGDPGVLMTMSAPGPYPTLIQRLYVLQGDGTLLTQGRARCADDSCPDLGMEWENGTLEEATVVIDPDMVTGCGTPDPPCEWQGSGEGHMPVADDWTCADL